MRVNYQIFYYALSCDIKIIMMKWNKMFVMKIINNKKFY
jgi:hypothetical protein